MLVRLPRFRGHCPHIHDQWISTNGGRVNLDHLHRVLRARAAVTAIVLDRKAVTEPKPKD